MLAECVGFSVNDRRDSALHAARSATASSLMRISVQIRPAFSNFCYPFQTRAMNLSLARYECISQKKIVLRTTSIQVYYSAATSVCVPGGALSGDLD